MRLAIARIHAGVGGAVARGSTRGCEETHDGPGPGALASVATTRAGGELVGLVYELLDAHADTAELATRTLPSQGPLWAAHLDYLRGLQRCARETLARHSEADLA
jgi:hypothetical protein